MKFKSYIVASLALGLLAGCGTDENNKSQNNQASNNQMSGNNADAKTDMPEDNEPDGGNSMDEPDMPEDVDMPPACEPLTECPAEACGAVDDGCGGMVACATACACVDGVAEGDGACGTCGLGVLVCGEGETGAGTCEAPDLSGLSEGMCQHVVYVDAAADADAADGTREQPYAQLGVALDALSTARVDAALVLVAAGTYADAEPFTVSDSVSIIGGFDPATWTLQDGGLSRFEMAEDASADRILGVSVVLVDEPTLVANLEIQTADALMPGVNVIGVRVSESPGLVLRNVHVQAGNASDGITGRDGDDGADADPMEGRGGDAGNAIHARIDTVGSKHFNGAWPGTPGLNMACSEASGGTGGFGARGSYNEVGGVFQIYDAEQGETSALGGVGGAGGTSGAPNGTDGLSREDSVRAEDGVAGKAAGQLETGRWVLPEGDGVSGFSGAHGAGGGGGGGSWWPTANVADHKYQKRPGASGGGGGAGGCGGQGGEAGTAGGTSFGLLVIKTQGLAIEGSTFKAGDGGDGGAGGRGGRGGLGAEGGEATKFAQTTMTSTPVAHPRTAGDGGDGADGGDAGDGGSGAGGSSFGVYCEASSLESVGEVTFEAGSEGLGGVGTLPAESGTAVNNQGCQ